MDGGFPGTQHCCGHLMQPLCSRYYRRKELPELSSACIKNIFLIVLCPLLLSLPHRENWTLPDFGQEHLHIFPGRFLGRLPSETVVLPAIGAAAWNWKISFPLYPWKWGGAHRTVLGPDRREEEVRVKLHRQQWGALLTQAVQQTWAHTTALSCPAP